LRNSSFSKSKFKSHLETKLEELVGATSTTLPTLIHVSDKYLVINHHHNECQTIVVLLSGLRKSSTSFHCAYLGSWEFGIDGT